MGPPSRRMDNSREAGLGGLAALPASVPRQQYSKPLGTRPKEPLLDKSLHPHGAHLKSLGGGAETQSRG